MFQLTLILAGLISTAPVEPSLALPDNLQAYQLEKARTGADSGSNLRLALWCEARGLEPEKMRHLAIAVLSDPANATARGLMGLLSYQGRWESPDAVAEKLNADEARNAKLAAYNALRGKIDKVMAPGTMKSGTKEAIRFAFEHAKLGMWCEQNGLKPEATAHFTQAVVLDPYRDTTWKHLGFVRHLGRWMTHEQVAAEAIENKRQRKSDADWGRHLKASLESIRDQSKRDKAIEELKSVLDPRAVPSIVHFFASGSELEQELAVEMLARIETPLSTSELAELAIQGQSKNVRMAASETLRRRDMREYGEKLVALIRSPMTYAIQPVGGPGSSGFLRVETPQFKMLRGYEAPEVFNTRGFQGYVGIGPNGLPVIASPAELLRTPVPSLKPGSVARSEERAREFIADANMKAMVSHERMVNDVKAIEYANADSSVVNERVISTLKEALGAPDLGYDETAWRTWWYDRLGYRYEPPQQIFLEVNASPQYPPPTLGGSCFAAGTVVRTIDGHRTIESIRVGDQVLSQNVVTGALDYKSVNVVHHNPPASTIHVKFDNGDTVVASTYHRFWCAGRGWAMARELKIGDLLRTLGGTSKVVSLEIGETVPVFNLDVAGSHTYFVGERDALVHDNTLPELREKGFDVAATN